MVSDVVSVKEEHEEDDYEYRVPIKQEKTLETAVDDTENTAAGSDADADNLSSKEVNDEVDSNNEADKSPRNEEDENLSES